MIYYIINQCTPWYSILYTFLQKFTISDDNNRVSTNPAWQICIRDVKIVFSWKSNSQPYLQHCEIEQNEIRTVLLGGKLFASMNAGTGTLRVRRDARIWISNGG